MPDSLSETVKVISEVFKVLGLVAGGLWAAWTFQKLQKAQAAELENKKKLGEIQKSRLELLSQQPQFAMQLEVTEAPGEADACKSYLCISVVLENQGTQNFRIEFGDSTVIVGRLAWDEDKRPKIQVVQRFCALYFLPGSDNPQKFTERIFRVGQKRRMALAVLPVQEPGGYFVQFEAVYSRIPFDGETASSKKTFPIHAIEQAFCFASTERKELPRSAITVRGEHTGENRAPTSHLAQLHSAQSARLEELIEGEAPGETGEGHVTIPGLKDETD